MKKAILSAGFTLLEALVSLVIFSLIGVLLLQGLRLVLSAKETAERTVAESSGDMLWKNWWRSSIRFSVDAGAYSIEGNSREITFWTASPALDSGFLQVQWRLVPRPSQAELQYREQGGEWLAVAELSASTSIQYLGADGSLHAEWSPSSGRAQLAAVQLTDGEIGWSLTASRRVLREPSLQASDTEFSSGL